MRKLIQLNENLQEMIVKLAEGNPGGLTVLMELYKEQEIGVIGTFLHLDDMNIRGSQLWVAYKDYCKKDLSKLISAVESRDPEMVKTVNEACAQYGETAVTNNASWR